MREQHSHPKKNLSKISNPCKKRKFQFNQIKSAPATMREQHRGQSPRYTATRHAPGLNPAPKHYRTTASPPPPPPRRPPPAAASRQRALPNPNLCTPASAAAPSPHIAHYATPFCLRTAALYCAPHGTETAEHKIPTTNL
jgi:hypothetical protein